MSKTGAGIETGETRNRGGRTLIMLPTYNEAQNVGHVHQAIRELRVEADILFLDDNSPDGTGKIIDQLAEKDRATHVIHRPEKRGIGSAHKDGIRWAYNQGYQVLITMDSDLTHAPTYILDFLRESSSGDVVVGSRYMRNDSLESWSLFRKSLTHLGHFLTKNLLSLPFDASGAFRLYNLPKIDRRLFALAQSNGYSFFFESLFILHMNGTPIHEVPIDLPARTYGTSKMTWTDAWHSLRFLFHLYGRKVWNKRSLTVPAAELLHDH